MAVRVRTTAGMPGGAPAHPGDLMECSEGVARQLVGAGLAEIASPNSAGAAYSPWPLEGCSVDEAFRRTADPHLWNVCIDAQRELNAAGGRQRRRIISIVRSDERSLEEIRRSRHRHELATRYDKLQNELTQVFLDFFPQGKLVAQGYRATPTAEPTVIRSGAWKYFGIHSWEKSVAYERTAEKTFWYDLRVFPVLHAPDAAERISRLSLSAIFRDFVFSDPETLALAKRRLNRDLFQMLFDDRNFSRLEELKWPLRLDSPFAFHPIDLISYWQREPSSEVTVAMALLAQAIEPRLRALEQLLTSGRVQTFGTSRTTDLVSAIGRLEWARRQIWVDLRNSDLVEEDDDGQKARWTGISVEPAGVAPVNDLSLASAENDQRDFSRETDHVPPSTTEHGGSEAAEPSKALERARAGQAVGQECEDWLRLKVEASKGEKVGTKDSWWQRAQEKWPQLSYSQFKTAWTNATSGPMGVKWRSSGRPENQIDNRFDWT